MWRELGNSGKDVKRLFVQSKIRNVFGKGGKDVRKLPEHMSVVRFVGNSGNVVRPILDISRTPFSCKFMYCDIELDLFLKFFPTPC